MALVLKDRVRETSTSTGTGTFTLGGAVAGFQSFSAIGTGNSTYYTIVMSTDWEVGIGTWTSPNQLSRDTILASTNAGAAVNFGSGTKDIFLTYPAEVAIAGSGTTNYVPKFTSSSAIGNSLIYDNGTNVGIGTSSPSAHLDVSGSGSQYVRASSSTNAAFRGFDFGEAGSATSYGSMAMNLNSGELRLIAGFSAWGGLQTFYTNGSERMRIDSSGNVGIGTSSPATKLDVDGLVKTKGYTVATLPTGVTGARAYVTDAIAPTFLGALIGGGTVTCPVFYNGTAWVSG